MGMCLFCRGDDHAHHQARYHPEQGIRRKGIKVEGKNPTFECQCPECTQPDGWRGEPTRMPERPHYVFPKGWYQPPTPQELEQMDRDEARKARIAMIRARKFGPRSQR